MEDKALKKAVQDSISRNNDTLSNALQVSPTTFQQIVEKCASQRIISRGEKNTYLDTFTGQSLAYRAGQLVSNLQSTVGVVPRTLDDILCILHESDSLVVQEAAKKIAKDCRFILPKSCWLSTRTFTSSSITYTETRPSRKVSQSTLTIRNLKEVLNDLRDGDFNDKSWYSLRVELGLRSRTLNNIKSDYSEAEECLRACISKWLGRADDVDANGGANWTTLCNAIERINETGAAHIRDQHMLSQPVEQINYQDHSVPSQITSSDDETQLRQRPPHTTTAPSSNEPSGREGADKPPPSNPSSPVMKIVVGVVLLFLFALLFLKFWK